MAGCEPRTPPEPVDQSIRPAKIFVVQDQADTVRHQFVGRVEAAQSVDVTFEVSGPLTELPIREGQTLAEGALIAAIDPTDFELAVREARVQLKLARQDLERKQQVLDRRGIARSVVDDARSMYELQQVRLDKARESLADSRLVAPFEAYVAERYVDNHVNIAVGQKVARVYDLRQLLIVASIPEALVATGNADQIVSLTARFDYVPDRHFDLEIFENRGEADAVAQTYEVSFAMDRPTDWNLLPGMTAMLTVELRDADAGTFTALIPTSALVTTAAAGGEHAFAVWLFDPDTQAVTRRDVELGDPQLRGVQVVSGLSSGDMIVAAGASQLQAGMRVRVLGEPITQL